MNAIYFIGVGQALMVAALVASRPKKQVVDYILVIWMAMCSIHLVFFYLNFINQTAEFPRLMIAGGLLQFLSAPLLYLYVRSITNARVTIKELMLHALPYIIYLTYFQLAYNEEDFKVFDGFIHVYKGDFLLQNYSSGLAITSFVYPLISFLKLRKHRRAILNEFSSIEKLTLDWLRHWIVLELLAFIISYIVIWFATFEIIDYVLSFRILALIIMVNVFVVGFFGLRQPVITMSLEKEPKQKYRRTGLSFEQASKLLDRLHQSMEKNKPFLDQELSLDILAEQLDTSKHHLSQVLNKDLGVSFYEFINKARVQEFKERLLSDDFHHLSILGIALECGFSSKSSFNQVFKSLEGITPTEFRKRNSTN